MLTDKNKYKTLKIGIDTLSVIFIAYLVIVCPIFGHYVSNIYSPDGRIILPIKLMFADGPLAVFGAFWLLFRYADGLAKKYPFIFDPRPQYRILTVTGALSLYLIGYLILKNTLWR
jgi:hypothetical protein